ncbi:MAG TPA: hypothetical protein VF699_09845 [Caulobacteraceae bacterium]
MSIPLRDRRSDMPTFTVLSRRDAFVDYVTDVEAGSAKEAVEIAYDGLPDAAWEERGVVEFDARHLVALDENGNEIESTATGDFT